MKKRTYLIIQLGLGALLITYLIAAINNSNFGCDILSTIGALVASIILFKAYTLTEQPKLCWLFPSLAFFSWVIASCLWAFYELVLGINPENIVGFMAIFLIPNIFIILSFFSFFLAAKSHWNNFQISLDILAISAVLLTMCAVFFNKQFEMLTNFDMYYTLLFLYLLSDFILLGGVIVWFVCLRKGETPVIGKLVFTSILCFGFTDLFCNYLIINDLYIPNSMMDAAYVLSLMFFAQAGLWEIYKPEGPMKLDQIIALDYSSSKRNGLFLLLAPIIIILTTGFDLAIFLVFSTIIMAHQYLSSYVQTSINNERLLSREKAMNTILEERIAERTKELQQINEYLDILSKQDSITKLFNRRHILDTLDSMLEEDESTESIYVMYIDLDRFKTINDAYGHDIGDQVLVEIANRLDNCNRFNALLGRVGGDEFVLLLRGVYRYSEVETFAQEIIESCSKLIIIPPYQLYISLSIGITQYPKDACERSELMKNADIAMYHAKCQGFNQYTFFSTIGQKVYRRNKLEMLLKKAIYDKEFELLYQPQFTIPDKKLIGMEALLRWHHPDQGTIFPDEFIPIAEETCIIVPLGAWVIEQAVGQIALWNRSYDNALKMSINISPRQLDSFDLFSHLQMTISKSGISSQWLDIEITESITMKGETKVEEIFAMISELGVSISIDDFGTGYSSLSYLKQYSFDRIKIDKTLIDNITTDYSAVQIVKAIVMIGRSLAIRTIAEGVEHQEQLDLLTKLGCDEVQGYLFSKPITASEFEQLFLQQEDRTAHIL